MYNRVQLKKSTDEIGILNDKVQHMEGYFNVYKSKIETLELEKKSFLIEKKTVISKNQRELKKLKNIKGEDLAKNLLWKRLQLYSSQSPLSVPSILYKILLVPELAPAQKVSRLFRSLFYSVIQIREDESYIIEGAGGNKKHT